MRLSSPATARPRSRTLRRPRRAAPVVLLCAALLCAAATPSRAAAPTGPVRAASGPDPAAQALARTPPMGFNNWNSTQCGPGFDEDMVKEIADLFVRRGLKAAGYTYVNLDDCWAAPQRDARGELVSDPARFPHGMRALADYVHARGLRFGLYSSAGTRTCDPTGMPGALGHERSDARQFAGWGVDYLKYDNCHNQGVDPRRRYGAMRDAVRAATRVTGRPMLLGVCEWGQNAPWTWAADYGQLWRTTYDIHDTWASMLGIARQNLPLARWAGPGHWNDPDMLEVGNGGMTATEYRTHFSLWAMMAAPLLIGTDLRRASPATYATLLNREVIALDQDRLGRQGVVRASDAKGWTVVKELAGGDRAVALVNTSGRARRMGTTAAAAGLPPAARYRLRDLWRHRDRWTTGAMAAEVPAHGTVLYRVRAQGA